MPPHSILLRIEPMKLAIVALSCAVIVVCADGQASGQAAREWSPSELEILRSLTLSSLPKLPPDPSNKYADDPRAADFGHRLFFDTRLSSNGAVACVTCHQPDRYFTDGKNVSVGVGVTTRNAPTIVGAAYNIWFFWDGRKDRQWSQPLGSLENPLEQNMPRQRLIATIRANGDLAHDYTAVFGSLPAAGDADGVNRAFANIGKAIAAYERRIMPGPARFDRYVDAVLAGREPAPQDALTLDETQGLHVFIDEQRGRCLRCHNGPLFTDQHFHNIGVDSPTSDPGAEGRIAGVETALADEFNCAGKYSDAAPKDCAELKYARRHSPELRGAFKVPTLRGLPKTGPYMHIGNLRSLNDVMWHYRNLPPARIGTTELDNFTITGAEFDELEAFLHTLYGPIAAPAKYLRPPEPARPN
jgi:cytochrome c peroxidase